jgi:hypothetical protein
LAVREVTLDSNQKEIKMNIRKGCTVTALIAIAITIAAPSFSAQSQSVRATIPFDFYVADRLLPAGAYTIAPLANSDAVRVYDNRGNSAFVLTALLRENRATDYNRLVFRRYGTTSFLTSIYWEGFKSGRDVAASKMEKKIAQKDTIPPTSVAVLLK